MTKWKEWIEKNGKTPSNRGELINAKNSGVELDYLFFWGHTEKDNQVTKACLSQWYSCEFEVEGVRFHTAEQYMMAQKAMLFHDNKVYREIMKESSPKAYKALGRMIKGFDGKAWDENKVRIVVEGNKAKFSQNEKLKRYLIGTEGKVLVEASPEDRIWGIGMSWQEKMVWEPSLWKGENLLGFALMEVREWIRK